MTPSNSQEEITLKINVLANPSKFEFEEYFCLRMYGIDRTPINKETMKMISKTFGAEPVAFTPYIEGIGVYIFFKDIVEVI